MSRHEPPPPLLESFDRPPTWLNRAGRVDRSACFTLRVATYWRTLPDDAWRDQRTNDHLRRRRPERVGTIELCAHDLWVLHRFENPRPLEGDRRTTKSNAMRVGKGRERAEPAPYSPSSSSSPSPSPLIPNPNRGVGFSMGLKMLGLPAAWESTLTIERYRQHARLSQHFWVCPVCGSGDASEDATSDACPVSASGVRRPPAMAAKKSLPPGRVSKLYLPLCTPREWDDAQVAWLWLRTHVRPTAPLSPAAAGLIERYGELFPVQGGRSLRCRSCLGLRYGEVKAHQPAHKKRTAAPPPPRLTPIAPPRRSKKPASGAAPPRAVGTKSPEDLSAAEREALLLDLCRLLPSFQALAVAKRLYENV
jgi:hypothetical protein